MRWVVDASVAVKWIVAEEQDDAAEELLVPGIVRAAPELLLVEVANVLRNKLSRGGMSPTQAQVGLDFVRTAVPNLVPDRDLVGRALSLAAELDHPVYDLMYVACAERENMRVMTADGRFQKRVASSPYAPIVVSLPIRIGASHG